MSEFSFISKLFGKKKSIGELFTELETACREVNAAKTAELYYEIGKRFMEEGREEKAYLYISRFDTLVGEDDMLYKKFEKKDEQASDWIGMFEEKNFFAKEMRDMVEEDCEDLDVKQRVQWNLLTLARCHTLFAKLSELSGFEVFQDYERIIDIFAKSLYHQCSEQEIGVLIGYITEFQDRIDYTTLMDAKKRIAIAGGADFEGYDLTGDNLLLNLYLVLDEMICLLEGKGSDVSIDFVTNALHTGYYVRTQEMDLHEIKALQQEKARIIADYDFVSDSPSEEEFQARMHEYKKLMLPV